MNIARETKKAYIASILKACIYIEKNLNSELSLDEIAKAAGFSPYHFHRIFSSMVKESLNDYVRRLRVEKAAGSLKYRNTSITTIALDSGYSTPSAFTRAFSQVMGLSPKEFRKTRDLLCDVWINLNKKEKKMKDPEIVTINEIKVLFVRKTGSYYKSPQAAWETLSKFIKKNDKALGQARRFGIALDDPNITEEDNIRFDACVEEKQTGLNSGEVGRQSLPSGKYAIFLHKGPYKGLSKTYDDIFGQWYPENKDAVESAPSFVEYLNMEKMFDKPDELLTKIYIKLK